jgi:poly(3-hydroxybutyrate) depolymerase
MRATIFGGLAVVATIASACGPAAAPKAALSSSDSWCPDGFEVGPPDTDSCFAMPATTDKNTPVLVYLHGMYKDHGSPQEWSVVHSASDRGFAVIIPRGKRGQCAWKAELKDQYCWPQEAEDPQSFKQIVAEWDKVLWQVDAIMDEKDLKPHKRYVLGFSNGGFFAGQLAMHGYFDARAYAIVNAGSLEAPPKPPAKAPAIMLVSAQDDAEQAPKMKELHDGLSKSGWTHAYCSRAGTHQLSTDDVDAALRFFEHDAKGTLKADAKGYACEGMTKAVAEK